MSAAGPKDRRIHKSELLIGLNYGHTEEQILRKQISGTYPSPLPGYP